MKHQIYKKVVLVVLDGFGIAPVRPGNAIAQARTPTLDYFVSNFPALTLQASGPLVGLPWGEMGNSEVGHLNLGAGRIVGQDQPRITLSIQSGEFFKNPVFLQAVQHVKDNNSSLHLIGLVSAGGVHSLDEHLYALLGLAGEIGLKKVYIHMFTDGRDTGPKVALETLQKLDERVKRAGTGKVATVTGRFFALDRGGHWGQTMQTYKAMVEGAGKQAQSAEGAVRASYESQIFDEMIPPTVVVDENGQPAGKISDNDAVIFFNFRSDRALQLSQAFVQPEKVPQEFRPKALQNLFFATMTEYAADLPVKVAFRKISVKNNLAEVISQRGLKQFHIAESEKYAHVTSFFDCGTEKYPGEEQVIVKSPSGNENNYSDHPEMSSAEVTKILTEKIGEDFSLYVANFANGDMVGHTGNLPAGIKAVEALDACLKTILDSTLSAGAALLVTADHGNIEQLIDPVTGEIDKDHTTNPVPLLLAANELKYPKSFDKKFTFLSSRLPAGAISDVAPTILDLMGIPKPEEMTGINLLDEIDEVPTKR